MKNWMSSKPFAFLSLLTFCLLLVDSPAKGDETVILNIVLNQENKGEYYIIMRDDGDFFIKAEDLKKIGFKDLEGEVYEIEGELYVLLSSIRGIEFHLDEVKLSLEITALPFHFPKQVFDLQHRRLENVRYPADTSAFLNYNLQYSKATSSRIVDLTNELGLRHRNLLFLTDSEYSKDDSEEDFVRLMTNLTYDRRKQLQRVVMGDFFAPASIFGTSLNMGGIRFHKAYETAPYLITHPLINFFGSATLPSELEIYLDGRIYHSEKLHPGEFALRNLFPREGGGQMEVVIRDPFGREERLDIPFYLTTALLRSGYHDYSYSMGFLREQFGFKSFEYDDFVVSGYHFYGMNDSMTTGLNAEISGGRYNIGPSGAFRLWDAGVLALALAASRNDDRENGMAESLGYTYQTQRFNFQTTLKGFSRDYASLTETTSQTGTQFDSLTGMGYNTETLGSFGVGYEIVRKYEEPSQRITTARYARRLYHRLRMIALFRIIRGEEDAEEFFISLIYNPFRKTTVSTSYFRQEDANTETFQVESAPPFGEGFGGRASYERTDSDTQSTNAFNGSLQYNARYGTVIGRYQSQGSDQTYQASAAGGIAYVARTVSIGRPVTDSFALVEVEDLKNVRVYVNNNEIGRTDSSGRLFVPDLASYYKNQVSIDDHDIPIDYTFPDVKQLISPLGRSGSYVLFETSKYRAIFGKIIIKTTTESHLLRLYEIRMEVEGKPLTFQTTGEGEFYVENVYAGEYRASFIYNQKPCEFDIIVPETEENLIDLGELICEQTD
jgi:outer membrane usher protein FimD/PapC